MRFKELSKKLGVLFLCGTMLLSSAGCGSNTTEQPVTASSEASVSSELPVDNPSSSSIEEQPAATTAPIVKEKYSDFYQEVNADWIAENQLKDYELQNGAVYATDSEITDVLISYLENTDPSTLSEDDPYYKLITLYHQTLAALEDEEGTMAQIKEHTDAFQKASSAKDLNNLFHDKTNFRSNNLFSLSYDMNGRGYYIPTLRAQPFWGIYNEFSEQDHAIIINGTARELMLLGYSEKDAQRMAENSMKVNDLILEYAAMDDGYYYFITADTLKEDPCSIDLVDALTSFGFDIPKNLYMSGDDGYWCINGYQELLNKLCSKEYLQAFKDYSSVQMMDYLRRFGSRALYEENLVMTYQLCGLSEEAARNVPLEENREQLIALSVCNASDQGNLSKYYADAYISEEDRNKLTDYLGRIQEAFAEIIDEADWLTPRLRERLKVKVKTINIIWGSYDEYNTFEGAAIGDNAIDTMISLANSNMDFKRDHLVGQQNKIPEYVDMNETNAYYMYHTNSIVICNGMYVSVNSRFNNSFDEWIAAFGCTLAHEVGHAFQYSNIDRASNGLYEDTFFDEDQQNHYYEYYQNIYGNLDGMVTAYGNTLISSRFTNETFADLFSMKVCLRILAKEENADYDTFFKTFAADYACVSRPTVEAFELLSDTHLPAHERVNTTLSHFKEFYDTYDINPDGASYLPEDQRIDLFQ